MYRGLQNITYTTGRLMGKGGEGQVFDVNENPALLAKLYNEAPDSQRVNKLLYMASVQKPAIHQFAAWPTDVLLQNNQVAGFVMKKLTGYVPLHMLFSPMDRKKLFPDKGYNFLVHVARNLATAFYKLHQEGIVIGDVNEGNVLVNAQGMVAFIDCDSFQIQNGNQYYYCEVGVPRYTAPELLQQQTFENVIRTPNTDTFSLAILLFQLLFLGRHPFAGVNLSKEDLDEEKAIRQHQFAYSLRNTHKKLQPALNSFDITNLSTFVIQLFHQAFEQNANRPLPAEWVQQLDAMGKDMVSCPKSKLHTYPATAPQCPWCYFKEQQGILFFLDGTTQVSVPLMADIQQFVNGFKPEKLVLNQLSTSYTIPQHIHPLIEKQWHSYRKWHLYSLLAALFTTPLLALFYTINITALIWAATLALLYYVSPWRRRLKAELEKRNADFRTETVRLSGLVKSHNEPAELKQYQKTATQLEGAIETFKQLPLQFQERKKELEEQLYNKQLLFFLCAFDINSHTIPGIGTAKKQLLYNNGVRNAADISQLYSIKIAGIGPKNLQLLFDWQRQMSVNFTYRPNYDLIGKETAKAADAIQKEKVQLETDIKKHYQALQAAKLNVIARQQALEAQYNKLVLQVMQADVNYTAFKELI
ncbi:DNA-binding helix-hairpin-helix protein with protein kinase domain [Filimonas zeae]|nr:protein kinase [Filimonas zeae]MDR6341561.1 DNA-binding helix-hairpin-helix protein with protein kinase domain [Filimonas zeae]